jgi:multisubunit Na+/H+ antiporter MnhF subunit
MKVNNIHIMVVAIVMIIGGIGLRLSFSSYIEVRIFGSCIAFVGLLILALYLYDELKK